MSVASYLADVEGFNPLMLVQKVADAGTTWAKANAHAELLEKTLKSTLAGLVEEQIECAAALDQKMPRVQADNRALMSQAYRDAIREVVTARRAADEARVAYDAGRTYMDLMRTFQSTLRAEMGLAGRL